MSRVGGSSGFKFPPNTPGVDHLECWQETLIDAPHAINYRTAKLATSDRSKMEAAKEELRSPDKAAIAAADERAETLIADAQALDPRLVRQAAWVRSCEGETACPALLLAGEENAFFERRRQSLGEAVSGEPVLVVVSTDSSEITADSLAAFVATVKLVQQFRPVHVVWQGAWMVNEYKGFVFHCPVITGDMDFERLAFVINSELRDTVSFSFMVRRAISVTRQRWSDPKGKAEHPAERSYLPNSVDFVNHGGIVADAENIANRACRWLSWEAPWANRYNERAMASAALCRWDEGEESMRPESTWAPATPAERAKWEEESKIRAKRDEEQKREEAARRMASV